MREKKKDKGGKKTELGKRWAVERKKEWEKIEKSI